MYMYNVKMVYFEIDVNAHQTGEVGEILTLYRLELPSSDSKVKLKLPCFFLQVALFLQKSLFCSKSDKAIVINVKIHRNVNLYSQISRQNE